MKFIVDAQLPRRLTRDLLAAGHDAVHTLDLAKGNRTPDGEITSAAMLENRVVVTKDEDFVTHFLLRGAPPKLLLVSTGNISNDALSHLFAVNLPAVVAALAGHDFVELSASSITIHE
jgi:predicted nuclease of predicted toxin-antitoxin system